MKWLEIMLCENSGSVSIHAQLIHESTMNIIIIIIVARIQLFIHSRFW